MKDLLGRELKAMNARENPYFPFVAALSQAIGRFRATFSRKLFIKLIIFQREFCESLMTGRHNGG